jgi:hypothetical protein
LKFLKKFANFLEVSIYWKSTWLKQDTREVNAVSVFIFCLPQF